MASDIILVFCPSDFFFRFLRKRSSSRKLFGYFSGNGCVFAPGSNFDRVQIVIFIEAWSSPLGAPVYIIFCIHASSGSRKSTLEFHVGTPCRVQLSCLFLGSVNRIFYREYRGLSLKYPIQKTPPPKESGSVSKSTSNPTPYLRESSRTQMGVGQFNDNFRHRPDSLGGGVFQSGSSVTTHGIK